MVGMMAAILERNLGGINDAPIAAMVLCFLDGKVPLVSDGQDNLIEQRGKT
jgi:hypothetical protein